MNATYYPQANRKLGGTEVLAERDGQGTATVQIPDGLSESGSRLLTGVTIATSTQVCNGPHVVFSEAPAAEAEGAALESPETKPDSLETPETTVKPSDNESPQITL